MEGLTPSGPMQLLVQFIAAETDGLWIDADAAVEAYAIPSAKSPVTLRFPPINPSKIGRADWYPFTKVRDQRNEAFGVLVLEAQVDIPATISQWDTQASITRALGQARSSVTHFLEWCKIRQPWIGAFESSPLLLDDPEITEVVTGNTRSLELRADLPRPAGPAVRRMDEPNLTSGEIAEFARRVGDGERPDPSSAFLADAYHATFCTFPRDLKRGVLLAAFACEIRLRDEFRAHRLPEAEVLYGAEYPDRGSRKKGKPSLSKWPGPVAKVLVGRSLEEEDSYLYEQFKELIALRNDLAHRGLEPPLDAALEGVRSARRIFEWLDTWKDGLAG